MTAAEVSESLIENLSDHVVRAAGVTGNTPSAFTP
jgi:hypothetical protein